MEIRDFLFEDRPGNKAKKIWNNVDGRTNDSRQYHVMKEYIMEPLVPRLTIRINNIDSENQKIFIDFIYDSQIQEIIYDQQKTENFPFRYGYIYILDIIWDKVYALKIKDILKDYVLLQMGYCDISKLNKSFENKKEG